MLEKVGIQEEFRLIKHPPRKFIVGIAGKKRSGKTTLAWVLAGRYDAVVAPFAAAIKGGATYHRSLLAFRPQWTQEIRQWLQNTGMAGRSMTVQGDLWIKCWQANFGTFYRCIIPDVRFPNEVEFIRGQGGKVIYLNYLGAPYDPHPSEQLSPQACDYVVEVTDENRQWAMVQVLDYLRNTFGDPPSKPRVYIGGNIHGERNYEEIFLYLERLGREFGFEPLVPLDATDRYRWANLVLEKPFHEASRELVIGDIQLISNSHAAFFWLERPSIGVAMEIIAASLNERPTVIVTPHLDLFYHPWLQSFGKVIWSDDQREGWKYLHSLFFPETI